jgi:hypothetical protein
LYEAIPPAATHGGIHEGWRGPLHAVVRKDAPAANQAGANVYNLQQESIKNITDGTSNTLLAAESTNAASRRRTFWAYTFGNYILSQTTPFAPTLWGDICRCTPTGSYPDICPGAVGSPAYGESNRACHSGWFSLHPSGMNAVRCDGSLTFIDWDIDLLAFAVMGSIADEDVTIPTREGR